MNYIGPNNGEGSRIYYDGAEVARDTEKDVWSHPAADGRIVVRRWYIDNDSDYSSVQVDELIYFNASLTSADVQSIYNSA